MCALVCVMRVLLARVCVSRAHLHLLLSRSLSFSHCTCTNSAKAHATLAKRETERERKLFVSCLRSTARIARDAGEQLTSKRKNEQEPLVSRGTTNTHTHTRSAHRLTGAKKILTEVNRARTLSTCVHPQLLLLPSTAHTHWALALASLSLSPSASHTHSLEPAKRMRQLTFTRCQPLCTNNQRSLTLLIATNGSHTHNYQQQQQQQLLQLPISSTSHTQISYCLSPPSSNTRHLALFPLSIITCRR